jgi:sodium/hydrogen exchanger 8
MLLGSILSGIIRILGGYDKEYIENAEMFEPRLLGFSSNVFFFGFLPPIIFNSGYHLKRKLFFKNIGAISGLAIIGTLISTFVIACSMYYLIENNIIKSILDFDFIECIAFGALISSTDPVSTLSVYSSLRVDPTLFYLVFGESVLNDAIAITLFKVSSKFVGYNMKSRDVYICLINFIICFISSCAIGYTSGILLALMYKSVNFKYSNIAAVSVFVTTVYIPFFLSETLQLSGIVTILCTGIAARRFINKNLNSSTRKFASDVFHLMSSISETSCFCLLGLSVFSFSIDEFNWSLIGWVIVLCLLGRAASVYPILFIVNYFKSVKNNLDSKNKYNNDNDNNNELEEGKKSIIVSNSNDLDVNTVSLKTIHCVFFSGSRGAVGFACANIFSNKHNNK